MNEVPVVTSRPQRLLRLAAVTSKIGLGPTKVYELIKAGDFVRPLKAGRASLWVESEVDAWIAARIGERDAATEAVR